MTRFAAIALAESSRGADGRWIRHRTRHHLDEESRRRDTRFARVYMARRFWYLGESAAPLPPEIAPLAGGNHLTRWTYDDLDAIRAP